MIVALGARIPEVSSTAWIAPSACVAGGVRIGHASSVFYGAVLRGDLADITVGDETNIQDGVVCHADPGYPLQIGHSVSVGHRAALHGCHVGDETLVGIGAVILNGAVIGRGSLIAAQALIPQGTVIPPYSLVAGVPATVRRRLRTEETNFIVENARRYRRIAALHVSAREVPQAELQAQSVALLTASGSSDH